MGEPLSIKKPHTPSWQWLALCGSVGRAWSLHVSPRPAICGPGFGPQNHQPCVPRISFCECLLRVEGAGRVLSLFRSFGVLNFSLLASTFSSPPWLQEASPHFFRLRWIDRWRRVSFGHGARARDWYRLQRDHHSKTSQPLSLRGS